VALDLHFARAAQVVAADGQTLEWIRAKHHVVLLHDLAVLNRKGVERPREARSGEQQWRGGPGAVPCVRACGTRVEVFYRQRADQGQCRNLPV
jgi:hypothetical protein